MEYDDIMNAQRKGVYGRRQNALKGERIGADIANMISEVCTSLANGVYEGYADFNNEVNRVLALELPFTEEEYPKLDSAQIAERLTEAAMHQLTRREEKMAEGIAPYVKEFVEERGATGPIGVPVTDGRRMFNIRADIRESYDKGCKPIVKAWEKAVLLSSIDAAWQEQLSELDELRRSVQNASYEQKDPLVI